MRKLLTEACLSLLMLETVVEEEEEISEVAGFVATKLLIVGSCENANTRAVGHAHVITHQPLVHGFHSRQDATSKGRLCHYRHREPCQRLFRSVISAASRSPRHLYQLPSVDLESPSCQKLLRVSTKP
jgi:hypothetical protein